jgi:hypothetical protein
MPQVVALGASNTVGKGVGYNPHFDAAGHFAGRAQMILGLLYKAKRKRASRCNI